MIKKKLDIFERMDEIFKIIIRENTPLSAMQIHTKSKIPRTTLSRILKTLYQLSYLKKIGSKYVIGTPHHFSTSFTFLLELQETCYPYIESLSQQTGQTIKISIPFRNKSRTILSHQGTKDISVTVNPNSEFPLHVGAASKVLLAFAPHQFTNDFLETAPFEKFTPTTITTTKALKRALNKTREQGFALDNQEYLLGIEAIAYPLFFHPLLTGAISVPMLNQKTEDTKYIYKEVKKTAAKINSVFKKNITF